jgi:lipopolysaccharide export system permease protein
VPLLQRYILAELLKVFTFVLFCLTLLVNFVGVFQTATESGLGARQVWQILPYIVPSMLPFTIPAALLLTVCLVYGRMAGDQEVTAAKSAGISVVSVLLPSFLLGGVLSVASLVLTDQVIPWALGQIEQTIVRTMEDVFLERLRTDHRFVDRHHGFDITVAAVRGRTLIKPVIRHIPKRGRTYTLMAEHATISLDAKAQTATIHVKRGFLDLSRGGKSEQINVEEWTEEISLTSELGKPKPRNLPIRVIQEQMSDALVQEKDARDRQLIDGLMALSVADFGRLQTLSKWGAMQDDEHSSTYHRLRTEVHSRYAMSCSCLFFVLLGGPFAIYKAKSQFLTSFLFCFVPIIAVYYPLILGLMAQAKRGNVDPAWAMWSGNFLLAVAAWAVLRRVIRY